MNHFIPVVSSTTMTAIAHCAEISRSPRVLIVGTLRPEHLAALEEAGCELVFDQPKVEPQADFLIMDECLRMYAHAEPTLSGTDLRREPDWKRKKYFGNRRNRR